MIQLDLPEVPPILIENGKEEYVFNLTNLGLPGSELVIGENVYFNLQNNYIEIQGLQDFILQPDGSFIVYSQDFSFKIPSQVFESILPFLQAFFTNK